MNRRIVSPVQSPNIIVTFFRSLLGSYCWWFFPAGSIKPQSHLIKFKNTNDCIQISFAFSSWITEIIFSKNLLVLTNNCNTKQGRIQGGARGAAPIIFSQETELRPEGPKKKFFETGPPLSHGLDDLPPNPFNWRSGRASAKETS